MNKNNLYFLSSDFYKKNSHLMEIMKKKERPYFMYNITVEGFEFAIPLRSDIKHKNFFPTGTTKTNEVCGIDYTKAVIIKDKTKDLKSTTVWIRPDEYINLRGNEHLIIKGFKRYLKAYKKAHKITEKGKGSLYEKNLCDFSTLKNYHSELGL